jgi:hypothetical protein
MQAKWNFDITKNHQAEVSMNMLGELDFNVDGKNEYHGIVKRGNNLDVEFLVEDKTGVLEVRYEKIVYPGMATMESWKHSLTVDGKPISSSR